MAADNTTAVYCLNKQGGMHSLSLLYLAIQLWEWCYSRHIYLVAVHVALKENRLAHKLSRLQDCTHEWSLDNYIFLSLCCHWGTLQLDVLTSIDNRKCALYCSRADIGHRLVGDAFMTTWSGGLLYMFLPIPLVQKAIVKV